MGKNAFDELLESMIPNEDHRKALAELAEQYPELRNGYLRQSDYSRKMDELRDKLNYSQQWEEWYQKNWVPDAYGDGKGATKRELEKDKLLQDREKALQEAQRRIEELSQQISVGGEVTFDELNSYLDKVLSERGLVKREEVESLVESKAKAAEGAITSNLAGYAHIATKGPKLMFRHYREFNEDLDFDKLLEHAVQNNITDLDKAYDEFVRAKRDELKEKEIQEKIEAARREERERLMKEQGMNRTSMPDDNSGPSMGPMKAKLLSFPTGEDGKPDLSQAQLGRGVLARVAAQEWDRRE